GAPQSERGDRGAAERRARLQQHHDLPAESRLREQGVVSMTDAVALPVERVQLGVRMEKSMVKVLKGLAEFEGVSLGHLMEKIVLHSFEPVPGAEGEMAASS